jgi:hypothetical protein
VLAARESDPEQTFGGGEPQVIQPVRFESRLGSALSSLERPATPQGKPFVQTPSRAARILRRDRLSVVDEPLEAAGVDLLGPDVERVCRGKRLNYLLADAGGAQGGTNPGNVDLDCVGRTVRRPLAPQLIDQSVAGDGHRRPNGKKHHQRPLFGAAESDQLPIVYYLERPEDSELQRPPKDGIDPIMSIGAPAKGGPGRMPAAADISLS